MKITLNTLYQELIAILLGAMLMLAFAPFEIYPLAIIAPAGLCALIYHASRQRAFWLGYMFGIGLFASGVYWIYISISQYGDVPAIGAGALTAALILYLSIFPGAACYFTNRYFTHDPHARLIFAFPAIWVLSEWIRSWLFTGFPWLIIGYSQTNSPLKGYAPIFSVYGVSIAVMMTSALLINGIIHIRKKNYQSGYLNLLAIVSIWLLGSALTLIPWSQPTGKPLTVSLIQGNIPQSLKWQPENVSLSFNRYQEMTAPLWKNSDIIIWPEIAIPVPLQNAQDFINDMSATAEKNNVSLILGIPIAASDGDGYHNAIISLGKYQTAYLKRHLVPFGEYVPFRKIFARAFDFMNVPMSNLKAGNFNQPPMQLGNIRILPSICYEIAYPGITRTEDPRTNIILTITNDAWFGESTAQAQHLQMAAMRSIEMAKPGLFVSNDGITAIIGPTGLIVAEAPAHVSHTLTGSVQPYFGLTPWMRNGIDPVLVLMIVLLALAYRASKKATPNKQKSEKK